MNQSSTSTRPGGFQPGNIRHWLAYGFGAGLSPQAPGTVGTLVAVPIYLLLSQLPLLLYLLVLAVMIGVGVWACTETAREIGSDDPPAIVWDEVVGFLVAMMAAPAGWVWVITGFLLFRLFDIYKPWPVSAADGGARGGVGIMLDDIIAGLMSFAVLQCLAMIVESSLRGTVH
ncbi:phosphatidylglycerophosphatase A [Thiohalocapsa marina]|uniref:Phosphatidylglycerophosphatase A n=1 Tax=Thiohalocapsa marina TaxID=424902 RepID=A0A5M8FVK8_9GAMM|nr:phosphatidylglycerophosphatase A [Thiohalocapsa marina]KAA6187836.1 phosphatidylglycerophosphatase A [Thiohalocapsa marina]